MSYANYPDQPHDVSGIQGSLLIEGGALDKPDYDGALRAGVGLPGETDAPLGARNTGQAPTAAANNRIRLFDDGTLTGQVGMQDMAAQLSGLGRLYNNPQAGDFGRITGLGMTPGVARRRAASSRPAKLASMAMTAASSPRRAVGQHHAGPGRRYLHRAPCARGHRDPGAGRRRQQHAGGPGRYRGRRQPAGAAVRLHQPGRPLLHRHARPPGGGPGAGLRQGGQQRAGRARGDPGRDPVRRRRRRPDLRRLGQRPDRRRRRQQHDPCRPGQQHRVRQCRPEHRPGDAHGHAQLAGPAFAVRADAGAESGSGRRTGGGRGG